MVNLKEILIVSVLVVAVVVSPADAAPDRLGRPGSCPNTDRDLTICPISAGCFDDYDCEYGYKCCPDNCGRECHPIAD
ncbi:caltrin-like protein 2 [Penaeus indicus]|uniref:caltrin-like protein 2 n=1 Tax=Penaeus indicus TaxID=29960 RepID=UPI00300CBEEA